MLIKWTGRNTQGNKIWTAEGETYQELYNNIYDKYGFDIINQEIDDELQAKEVKTEQDYVTALVESNSNDYFQDFTVIENEIH